MDNYQKIMIACLLISEGISEIEVQEFVDILEYGLIAQEQDSIILFEKLILRLDGPLPDGTAGGVIRLLKAKKALDDTCRKFGLAVTGLKKVINILETDPKNDMAAKILLNKALAIVKDPSE